MYVFPQENKKCKEDEWIDESDKKESRCFLLVRNMWRTFYLTAWVAAAFYSVYNISLFVNRYFERPTQIVITSVKPEHDGLEFPTVSICNMNKIEKAFLEVNPTLKKVWDRLEATKSVDWKNKTLAEIGNLTYSDIYAESFGWKRVVDQCKYGGWRDCKELDYHPSEMFTDNVGASGKCYTFNPRGTIFSRSVGNEGSFRFLMNTHSNQYLKSVSEVGFVVDIHHNSNFQGSSKIEMSPGYKYRVGIKPKIRVELPMQSGGECDPTRNITSYLAYDADSCEYECRDRYINATCGCIISAPPNNRYNYLTCSIKQMEDCGWLAYYYFLTRDENMPQHNSHPNEHGEEGGSQRRRYKFNQPRDKHTGKAAMSPSPVTGSTLVTSTETTMWPTTSVPVLFKDSSYLTCTKNCPPPCYKHYYDIVVSSSKISTRNARIMAKNIRSDRGLDISAEYLLENHVLMEFYLADSFTELIKSVRAYNLWLLLSDIGGVMGLFLGASIFTFFAFCKATVVRIYHSGKDRKSFCKLLKSVLNSA